MDKLLQEIFERQPIFAGIMKRHGHETVLEYVRHLFGSVTNHPYYSERNAQLSNTVSEIVSARLGSTVGEEVEQQIQKFPLVSTIDHHALVQHPFFLNTNIIMALSYSSQKEMPKYLVVLSFASISLNNSSGYPRGLLFHGNTENMSTIKVPLISERFKMAPVYGFPGYSKTDLVKAEKQIKNLVKEKQISKSEVNKICEWMWKEFGLFLNDPDLCSQITRLNYKVWPTLFADPETVPKLIYVEIEKVVAELLVKNHLNNPASPIYKLLFGDAEVARELFGGIRGSFGKKENWGTYFFWARVDMQRRRAFLKNKTFKTVDSSWECEWTPAALTWALKNKTIFPNMLFCYLVVSLYTGLNCLGGFCQVSDLTAAKLAWQKFLQSINHNEEAVAVGNIPTQLFGGDGMILATLDNREGGEAATGVDLAIGVAKKSLGEFKIIMDTKTLLEMIVPMIPEIHTIVTTVPR